MTLVLAVYGAGLSTVLGYLAWHRERHVVDVFGACSGSGEWYGMQLSVVNTGRRPVVVHGIHMECADGRPCFIDIEGASPFPKRLDESAELVVSAHAEDIERDVTAIVVTDSRRREHLTPFTEEMHEVLEAFCEHVAETQPRLVAEGRQRPRVIMREYDERLRRIAEREENAA
ncbi:DUF3450 domain-containing protein [Svornostia abyssi]|uniref:DUF3450 domain-containing protein n=1 Tax=Svornostia abyssi TaxID=2898438 RepID=A0ABY5PB26_9ACTN|nr:DUF3450 domain-containing protein [Parviterribacteraceae bacterium J379]